MPTPPSAPKKAQAIESLRRNFLAEKESARIYRELSEAEKSDKRRDVLRRMAEAEERHADRWGQKLTELGVAIPTMHCIYSN